MSRPLPPEPAVEVAATSQRPAVPALPGADRALARRRWKRHALALALEAVVVAAAVLLVGGGAGDDLAGSVVASALPPFAAAAFLLHAAITSSFVALVEGVSLVAIHAGTLTPLGLCLGACGALAGS
ncbi:MAG: hypothetical protein IT373_26490 [Polyangiaceae bacterium]|nr:hypothetical protein [Polyangiaceae bacterium]